jgi:hypothetical protein
MGENPLNDGWVVDRGDQRYPSFGKAFATQTRAPWSTLAVQHVERVVFELRPYLCPVSAGGSHRVVASLSRRLVNLSQLRSSHGSRAMSNGRYARDPEPLGMVSAQLGDVLPGP